MTSYFFDTNFLFKNFFNRAYFTSAQFKEYINNPHPKYISKNVDYEFSNIYLEFSNQMNQFLIEPYFKIENNSRITLKTYQNLTKDIEILNFNNNAITSMIWKRINPENKALTGEKFKTGLKSFIYDFNSYFNYKYNDLYGRFEIHNRLEKYTEISDTLKPHLHEADLRICLDAHDVCIKNSLNDLVFVSADKTFQKNRELILENTGIEEIRLIK